MLSKREVKKSYYVWFLGAQEARVARGIRPALGALHRLERRAHDLDPFKVTLQVSPKGLKIIQNVDGRVKGGRGRNHTIKHFLPSDSVTEVVARGDAVVCVLLLYNPVTRCPLHAHAYRCDSEQTAQALCAQLRSVAGLGPEEEEEEEPIQTDDSPEHIEAHPHTHEPRLAPEQEVAAEKLAAELRKRLAGREPLLLPPRDYDTYKRAVPANTAPTAGRRPGKGVLGSSAGSSGIGSDLAPSPDRPHTSSEEDWGESTAYMLHEGYDGTGRRARSPSPVKPNNRNSMSADRAIIRNERSNGQSHSTGSISPKDRFNVAKEKFLNLERDKINDQIDKRAQMRRNLNNILSRGPKTPDELQYLRSGPKWPSDEEDIVAERRPEMPRVVMRGEVRDQRNLKTSRDDVRDHRMSREVRDTREYRESRAMHESRDTREYREAKEPLDMRELKEVKPFRDSREYREPRDYRDYRNTDVKEYKDAKEVRPSRDPRYARDDYNERDYRDARNYKESKDVKYLREYRDVDDKELRNTEERRNSREKGSRLEQRYYEYRGEKNDKFFDNRYKHDSRSDDEGVESEKQFEEIRYVPHVEIPRRREPDPRIGRMDKKEPVKDGRFELLEERQRQMESNRLDERYERRQQPDWDVLRRSYAEAERPRRDPRTRHSYAEPVARTRVGMATVAPF